jgi:hypothetical protein
MYGFVGLAIATAVLALTQAADAPGAAEPSESSRRAEDLVHEALLARMDGRNRQCDCLAREALKLSPDHPAARWLEGQAHVNGRWVKIEEAGALLAADEDYQEYLRTRPTRPQWADTPSRQFDLGEWCAQRHLTDQARGHYARAIQLSIEAGLSSDGGAQYARAMPPNSIGGKAAKRLGYKEVGGNWYSPAEYPQAQARWNQSNKDYAEWKPKIDKLRKALASSSRKARDAAREQLRTIRTPAAVSALETVLAPAGEKEAVLAAEAIGRVQGPGASLALARLAMSSDWEEARQQAAGQLRSRPLEEFVPALLERMRLPLDASGKPAQAGGADSPKQETAADSPSGSEPPPRGHFQIVSGGWQFWDYYYHAFTGFDQHWHWEGPVAYRTYVPSLPEVAAARNQPLMELNRRVAAALNDAAQQALSSEPEVWWSWWDKLYEAHTAEKPGVPRRYWQEPILLSTLAAETAVWTADGLRPVARIAAGDLVLAQDVETGELAYKPVLRATPGPPAALLALKAGDDTIPCTGQHAFWVPGGGWTRARKLDAGSRLHGLAGAVQVLAAGPGPKAATCNLVVADFNTYFVGRGKLLVHDATCPVPTSTDLPGLKRR